MNKKQMETKLEELARELELQKQRVSAPLPSNINADEILKYFIADKNQTAVLINSLVEQIKALREMVTENAYENQESFGEQPQEVVLSGIEKKILNFIQTQPSGMACADQVREFMGYKGNNAACAKLKSLEKMNLVTRYQMGHKVYYAGKATMQLIVSPPQ